MKITVLNKTQARDYKNKTNAIIIRMGDNAFFPKLEGNYIAEKIFTFSDITDATNPYAITPEDALSILLFLKENLTPSLEEIVVHCDYAKGRSPAVGAAISHFIFKQNFNLLSYPDYNHLVYERIKDELIKSQAHNF